MTLPETRVAVYEADNTTHVADLLVQPLQPAGPGGRAPTAVETARVLSEIEGGQVIVQADHPGADELVPGRVLRVTEGNVTRAPFTITRRKRVHLSDKGHIGETVTVTGKTLLDRWRKSLVEPWVGPNRRPIGRERIWDVTSPTFDDSSWISAFDQTREYAATQGMTIPRAWIDPFAKWIWCKPDNAAQPVGRVPFRRHFTLSEETLVVFFYSADNDFRVCVDGVELQRAPLPYPEFTWMRTYRSAVRLPAGDHVFAAVCENWATIAVENPAGFICSAWASDGKTVSGSTPLFTTGTGTWLTLDYPTPWPGFTVGEVLVGFLAEAQARDELAGWTLDFDGTEDSNGNPWPMVPQHSIRVGASGWDLLQSLGAWAEFDTAHEGLTLRAYDIVDAEGKGEEKQIAIGVGNALNIVETVDIDEQANSVLVAYKDGFRRRADTASVGDIGRLPATLEVGEVDELPQVNRLGDAFVEVHKSPNQSWLVDMIETPGAVPGDDFDIGDWLTVLDGEDPFRVMAIRWSLRDDGTLRPILQVSSLFEAKALNRQRVQERQVQLAGQGFGASSPIIDTGSKIPTGEIGNAPDIVFSWSSDDVEEDDVWPMDQPKEFCRLYEVVALADWVDPESEEKLTHGPTVLQVLDRGSPISGLSAITIPEESSGVTVQTWFTHIGPSSRLRLKLVSWGGHENGSVKLKCSEPV